MAPSTPDAAARVLWSILAEHDPIVAAHVSPVAEAADPRRPCIQPNWNVMCDLCKQSVICGPLYQCSQCKGTDFCAVCRPTHGKLGGDHAEDHSLNQVDPPDSIDFGDIELPLKAAGMRFNYDAVLAQIQYLRKANLKVDFNALETMNGVRFIKVFAGPSKRATGKRHSLTEAGIQAVQLLVDHFGLDLTLFPASPSDDNALHAAIFAGNVEIRRALAQ
ncbi:hypothetical protein DFJ73DRAFT_240641 [Zopfochytrium polystomum]|nr:hypothetical protein DFJ73DRAFT_240641 [Zopfochytrium polystomum]